ncbi:hypothetical protein [Microbulbifer aggregans]|uniref:hypothetical protein n=1 Tax=Microbulbifer aggregans TaxID=1769779 RepID=UPI001CFE8EDD|nr:hypothetical protein [Microbulbifer aggregans]
MRQQQSSQGGKKSRNPSKTRRELEAQLKKFRATVASPLQLEKAKSRAAAAVKARAGYGSTVEAHLTTMVGLKAIDQWLGKQEKRPARAVLPVRTSRQLADTLRESFRTQGASISEVARKSGCHRKTVEALLGGEGNPTLDVILKVASVAGLELCFDHKPQR